MDPNNPIVKLCVEGMRLEGQGSFEGALALFTQAWEASTDDFEACIAAHYLARRQDIPQDTLFWNQTALDRAEAAGDERVRDFYPSLYLNMGYSYEITGDRAQAARYYNLAAANLASLPESPYAALIHQALTNALHRLRPPDP